jgi:polyhydroxyalkanoate synthesis repressor PhaR
VELTIRIKKYGNRRFYSSADKSYVTLSQIEEWVRKGRTINVTDAESGDDITAQVLTQIILEQGRAQHLPIEMLETMIRLNEKTLKSIWAPLLEQNLKAFAKMTELTMDNVKNLMAPFSRKAGKKAPKE